MTEQPKKSSSLLTVVLVSLIIGGLAGGVASILLLNAANMGGIPGITAPRNSNSQPAVSAMVGQQSDVEQVVQSASPAVVSIIISKALPNIPTDSSNPLFNDPFFQQFFGQDFGQPPSPPSGSAGGTQKQEIGGGTGFIITSDGYIVTNKHVVIDPAADYTVLANDGKKYPAKVVARDPANDIAVLKIDSQNLPTVKLGDSSKLKLGQTVVAIGNALGEFRNTVSTGVVSGLSRSLTAGGPGFSESLSGVIQTDAAINEGNSGGPLLDLDGNVIAINTAMASGAQSIGFAIPINDVKAAIDSVKKNGTIVRAFLGVRYVLIDDSMAAKNNLPVNNGALVVPGQSADELAVMPGSPADIAGIVENDIIVKADGQDITAQNPLSLLINRHKPGDTIQLDVLHKGQRKTISVKLSQYKN